VNAGEVELIRGASHLPAAPSAVREALPWGVLLRSWPMWLICGQQFFRAAAQVFFGTWFSTFLHEAPRLSPREVSLLAGVPLLVLIAGALLGGILSDWILAQTGSRRWARQGFSVVNLLACAALFAAASQVQDAYVAVLLISAACLAMALGGVSAYAITMDMGGIHVATVFSIMNMSGSIGAAAFPKYVGWLLETTHNWDHVLLSIAVIYLAAAFCWLLLNPNGSVFDRKVPEQTSSIKPAGWA
jgi:MFS transporter, ACS family, D-galactonate transporter